MPADLTRVHFAYWGRRGGGARMTLELARAAVVHPALAATVSISRNNELLQEFRALGSAVQELETFASGAGALTNAWRLPTLRRQLLARLKADRTQAFVTLMPHVWSPLVAPAIRKAGVPYTTIVHDAAAHPGDRTGLVHGWLLRDLRHADRIVTLSAAVTRHLETRGAAGDTPIATLFTPDMGPAAEDGGGPVARPHPRDGAPFRIAFVGRIMPYKGLSLLIDAVRRVRGQGLLVELGVFGSGDLGAAREQLAQLGARVENRWLSDAELAAILAEQHAVVLSHTEASQSGVAALAGGHGVPLIATPVGGLAEQVRDGYNGVLAAAATPDALAAAIVRLAGDPALHARLCNTVRSSRAERSFARFLDTLLSVLPVRGS